MLSISFPKKATQKKCSDYLGHKLEPPVIKIKATNKRNNTLQTTSQTQLRIWWWRQRATCTCDVKIGYGLYSVFILGKLSAAQLLYDMDFRLLRAITVKLLWNLTSAVQCVLDHHCLSSAGRYCSLYSLLTWRIL